VSSRKEKGEERVGVGGRGKYPGAPPHHQRKKRENQLPDRKVPDRQGVVKGEGLKKTKRKRKSEENEWEWEEREIGRINELKEQRIRHISER
jgi:hypothetical protein